MDNIVIFLNAERGCSVLDAVANAGHGVVAVFCPESRITEQQIVNAAAKARAKLIAGEDVNSQRFIKQLSKLKPTISIIAGYSAIFHKELIDLPEMGTINLHAGRLPEYRGGSPLNWQIIAGEKEVGISVIRVDEGIDTGSVLSQDYFPVTATHNIADAHAKANAAFPGLVLDVLQKIESETLVETTQDSTRAAYWHQRNDDDGRIDWRGQNAAQIHNLVRAVTAPYPGAFCFLNGKKLRIMKTSIPETHFRGAPGRVLFLQGDGPFVICHDGALRLDKYHLQDGSKCRLASGTYLD